MKNLTIDNRNKSIQNFKKFELLKIQQNKVKGGDGGSTEGQDIVIDDDVHV